MAEDRWDECPLDARRVRELVAGLVKSLIQARWKSQPEFLPATQVNLWFPPDGGEVREDRRPARTHLGFAERGVRALRRLGVLPAELRCSAAPVPGPAHYVELVAAVERLLDGDLTVDDPAAAFREAVDRVGDAPDGWVRLIAWSELPGIRTLLYQFPEPDPPKPVLPRWDARGGQLWLDGRSVRTVAVQAKKQRVVLAAFEELGWPEWMHSPFQADTNELENAVRGLNERLTGLWFDKSPDHRQVGWRVVTPAGRSKSVPAKRSARR